jgi:hypothetical protein
MKLLREGFGQRVISKGIWPPTYPNFASPDFLLGSCKGKNSHTLEELKASVI